MQRSSVRRLGAVPINVYREVHAVSAEHRHLLRLGVIDAGTPRAAMQMVEETAAKDRRRHHPRLQRRCSSRRSHRAGWSTAIREADNTLAPLRQPQTAGVDRSVVDMEAIRDQLRRRVQPCRRGGKRRDVLKEDGVGAQPPRHVHHRAGHAQTWVAALHAETGERMRLARRAGKEHQTTTVPARAKPRSHAVADSVDIEQVETSRSMRGMIE